MRVFLELAYNGAPFVGWQKQPNGITVQESIEQALQLIYKKEMHIVGAGRTDTEVNALQMMAHVDLPESAITLRRLRHSLNGILQDTIQVKRIVPVQPDAHARFDAQWRTYHYYVAQSKSPFWGAFTLLHNPLPEIGLMNEAAKQLLGTQDFTSFSKLHTDTKHNFCTITKAQWQPLYDGSVLRFQITANRFLRNMVRAIVGTLLEVGVGKIPPKQIAHIIAAQDRSAAGYSVPGRALFLAHVQYPQEIFLPIKGEKGNIL